MWHEARKQERKIRGMLVDYRRRAERRRDFYEKIKADPTQFLQLHGRQCKIHLDPAVAAAADSPAAMMPWQGQADNLIDRFDVRAHLDYIPPVKKQEEEELTYEERQLNYERYRIIAQNSFLNITEEKFLKQLHMEEQFGYTESEPKKKKSTGAAIGFNYEDGTGTSQSNYADSNEACSDENSDSDLDVDLSINISKIDQFQAHEMNRHGRNFGMSSNDFYSFLTNDLEEAESYRIAREEEHEKSLFSGRKSRRERRAHREKRLANRVISPPSYAARTSPMYPTLRESKSASRSPSPEVSGKITYITSFGDEEEPTTSKPTYADKVKYGKSRRNRDCSVERTVFISRKRRSTSRERNYKRKRYRSDSSSDSRSPRPRSRRSRSSDRSRDRYRRSRSRSRSKTRGKSYRSKRSSTSSSDRRSRSRKLSSRSRSASSSSSSSSKSTKSRTPSSRSSSTSKSSAKSKSPSIKRESPPKTTLPRYYGRKRSDQSSSELSHSENDESVDKTKPNQASTDTRTSYGNTGTSIKKASAATSLSLQERLKRKRQALLNKQFKADKIAEQLKTEREKQEQQNREDELREMAIKLRRRQRERRHAYDSNNSSSSSDTEKKQKSPSPSESRAKSQSSSPRNKREDRERERKRDGREERRTNSPSVVIKRSPKRYDVEKRVIYREEPTSDRDRNYRRRDEHHRRDSREPTKRDAKERDRSNRSLVDY